jgi:hypothetical protein
MCPRFQTPAHVFRKPPNAKSGARLRVAARLIRTDKGYVVWSESYDRPLDEILMVQNDVAGEVTKALRASIEARPDLSSSPSIPSAPSRL